MENPRAKAVYAEVVTNENVQAVTAKGLAVTARKVVITEKGRLVTARKVVITERGQVATENGRADIKNDVVSRHKWFYMIAFVISSCASRNHSLNAGPPFLYSSRASSGLGGM